MSDVTAKFNKWQIPVDFDPKMQNVRRTLTEIKERLYLIELRCDDQQTIKEQLDHCMVNTCHPKSNFNRTVYSVISYHMNWTIY